MSEEIKVGDTVKIGDDASKEYLVKAVDGESAWIRRVDGGDPYPFTVDLKTLKLAPTTVGVPRKGVHVVINGKVTPPGDYHWTMERLHAGGGMKYTIETWVVDE